MEFNYEYFKEYVNTYDPKTNGCNNDETIINDMLYGIYVPFIYAYYFIKSKGKLNKHYWGIFIGDAQCSMKWYYTQEEVKDNLKKFKKNKKQEKRIKKLNRISK